MGLSVVDEIHFIGEEAKRHACRYLKQWKRILTQLFTPGLLLSALQSKLLSLEIYHSRAEPWRDIVMLILTKTVSQKVTKL